jgi:hypothetical protein
MVGASLRTLLFISKLARFVYFLLGRHYAMVEGRLLGTPFWTPNTYIQESLWE